MSFKTDWGTGELGDVIIADGATDKINSYARVIKIDGNTITIDTENMFHGDYEKFVAGNEILFHVSATNRTSADELGKFMLATITLVNGDVLTLDKEIFSVDLDYEYAQAVTVANFDCLTLKTGAIITPPPYNPFHFIGGIVALKCWDKLTFDGGNIDLTDCGIPAGRKNFLRPLLSQETAAQGETDGALYSGWENQMTADRLIMNAGDGIAFIAAKKLICHEDSRIGNPKTHGAQFCRGAKDSVGVKPSNITNIGGSTILIAAETIENFTPKIIAKYRSTDLMEGKGLCRCLIASNTKLRNDEGLYAYDCLADSKRLQSLGVNNFGNGSFGDCVNPTAPLNNYARVIAIDQGGHRLKISGETLQGLAPIDTGALVLIQVIQKFAAHMADAGKISVANILTRNFDEIIINFPAPIVNLNDYLMQIISIPQFDNFTLNQNFNRTTKFNGKLGGVCAIAVKDTCDISGGKINVEDKGGALAYGREGLAFIGNAQNADKLPLSAGNGSIFLLTKNLICNENSRIGATYSGNGTGGRFGGNNSDGSNQGGGYTGQFDENATGAGGGYLGGGAGSQGAQGGLGGSGANGGTAANRGNLNRKEIAGGYGSNGKSAGQFAGGSQGCHLMIIADNISGLSTANLSTGGGAGVGATPGAASYGGGGGLSSGGSGGFAFIYHN